MDFRSWGAEAGADGGDSACLLPDQVTSYCLRHPAPRDRSVTKRLSSYKQLDARWHDWAAVVDTLRQVAVAMVDAADSEAER
jgi:hypothetical protein